MMFRMKVYWDTTIFSAILSRETTPGTCSFPPRMTNPFQMDLNLKEGMPLGEEVKKEMAELFSLKL